MHRLRKRGTGCGNAQRRCESPGTLWLSAGFLWMEETHPAAEEVLQRVLQDPFSFAVPELFGFELDAVLEGLHPDPMEVFIEGVLCILEKNGVFRQPICDKLTVAAHRYVSLGLTRYDACSVFQFKFVTLT